MARALRHDRSPILYPDLQAAARASRKDRYLSILSLRAARAAYHSLADRGDFADTAGAQLQWQLRTLGRGLGLRLVIAGAPGGPRGPSAVN